MVRLRTDRWYTADGQRKSRSRVAQQYVGSRRLLSLCFLLALVLILMQKAADPRHVRNAFSALGVPLDNSGARAPRTGARILLDDADPLPTPGLSSIHSVTSLSDWEIVCRDLLARLLDELTDSEVQQLAKSWFRAPSVSTPGAHDSIDTVESDGHFPELKLADRSTELVNRLAHDTRQAAVAEAEKTAWLRQLEDFRQQWQQLGDAPQRNQLPVIISPELRSSITRYLDQRLLAMMRDATPWTTSDTIPFWRLLQRANAGGFDENDRPDLTLRSVSSDTPSLSTLQLSAEAAALRGALIRFRGYVRRVEHIDRSYSLLGIEGGYWILWLRGIDEALQPVAVYTSDPRAIELAKQLKPDTLDFPEIEVAAIFGKRLAYASESGVQVAPALFATDITVFAPGPAPFSTKTTNELWKQFLIAVIGAALLAAALIIPLGWHRRDRSWRKAIASKRPQPTAAVEGVDQTRTGRIARSLLIVIAALTAWLLSMVIANAQTTPNKVADTTTPLSRPTVITPPWAAKDAVDPLLDVYIANLQSLFDPTAADELRALQQNATTPFPNSLLKAIHATRRIGWPRALKLTESIALADGMTLQVRTLSGWVRLATPVLLSESQQSWFHLKDDERLIRVELQLQQNLFGNAPGSSVDSAAPPLNSDDSAELVTLYCTDVPKMWLSSVQLRQPAQFEVLAFEDANQPSKWLCGLAFRPQWLFPTDMSLGELERLLTPVLPQHYLELGKLGWDLANLETVAAHNQQALSSEEATGFYSLLRIMGTKQSETTAISRAITIPPAERPPVEGSFAQPLSVLSQSRQSVGKEITWPVRIVSATAVDVDQAEHRRQLAAESYVQLDGFVDIGTDRIRFQPAGADQAAAALEFEGEFPVTIVTRVESQLTSERRSPANQQGWLVGKYAIVTGRFYRLWSYQSELVKSSGPAARQIAPLVIASSIVPTTPPVRDKATEVGWFGWALCGAMVVILVGIVTSSLARPRRKRSI